MRRTDGQTPASPGMHLLGTPRATSTAHVVRGEQAPSTPWFGDRLEEPASSWESAWIDLGGEG